MAIVKLKYKTYSAKPEDIAREWYLVDAAGKTLGRLATEAARVLRGKHKPIYTPHLDTGDYVVVINAKKVRLTGKKEQEKIYYHHSRYPGGLKATSFSVMMGKDPTFVIREAVRGMLPKNRLGRAMLKKLKVFAEESHSYRNKNLKMLEF